MTLELTTVADDEAVLHDGANIRPMLELAPDTEYAVDGISFRTLPRPGELLCRFATVNDVHFGETECGVMEGFELGPIFASAPGEDPYPDVMNRGAVDEMAAIDPTVVLVKGDLTDRGVKQEYDAFLSMYGDAFGDRLQHFRGNHDAYEGAPFAANAPFTVDLPGVRLAAIDTVIPKHHTGQVSTDQIEWLDTVASESDRPVLVFGHHHVWSPESRSREAGYFGINPDDSERLVDVIARRPRILGYFAGHTHRNRVRRFHATGEVPWVEVACVKDFPGAWAEYRVFDGGILQIHRRISSPEALAWTEKTRGMFGGLYPAYAFGELKDRCFQIELR
ncbi:MAG: 3,5-cyclic-AMP phosphodiesterase [Acidimicrobiaceae bacterium]|jgi:predicted phosphodiesterase